MPCVSGNDLFKIVNNERYLKSLSDGRFATLRPSLQPLLQPAAACCVVLQHGSVKLTLRRDDSETIWQIINKSGAALEIGSAGTLQPAGTTDFEELLQR